MLVLSRRTGERVVLQTSDGDIEVEVLEHQRGKVRLAFTAPAAVKIYREEILRGYNLAPKGD